MPPPAGRGANPFSMVGKPLPTSFDAGVPLRDVQEAASHADPRTTMPYELPPVSLERHATYIVSAFIAGAAHERHSPGFGAHPPAPGRTAEPPPCELVQRGSRRKQVSR